MALSLMLVSTSDTIAISTSWLVEYIGPATVVVVLGRMRVMTDMAASVASAALTP